MKSLIFIVAMIAGHAAAAENEILAFKDLPLGASEEEVLKQYPLTNCSGDPARRICMLLFSSASIKLRTAAGIDTDAVTALRRSMTVANATVDSIFFRLYDGKLGQISMSPSANLYQKIATAFSDRYGKPDQDDVEMVTTGAGVRLENHTLAWNRIGGRIVIHRYAGSADKSSVMYWSADGLSKGLEENARDRQKAAKDL